MVAVFVACGPRSVAGDSDGCRAGVACDVGVVRDAEPDGGCPTPNPTCPGSGSPRECCTQVACGICYGDGFPVAECVNGRWTCGVSYRLISECTSFWSPYADAGPFPECDGG